MVIAPRTVDHLLGRYEELVSVVLAAPAQRASLRRQGRLILAADGLQPDKGHEVLWVVREVLSETSCWLAACWRPDATT